MRFKASIEPKMTYDAKGCDIEFKWYVIDDKGEIKPIDFDENKKDAIIVADAMNKFFKKVKK